MSNIELEKGTSEPPKDFVFLKMPKTVGSWRISGNLQIFVTKKPGWFHKWFTRLMLGWVWEDE